MSRDLRKDLLGTLASSPRDLAGRRTVRHPNLVAGFDNAGHKGFISDLLGIRKDGKETID
jgi:hypothetical protein